MIIEPKGREVQVISEPVPDEETGSWFSPEDPGKDYERRVVGSYLREGITTELDDPPNEHF